DAVDHDQRQHERRAAQLLDHLGGKFFRGHMATPASANISIQNPCWLSPTRGSTAVRMLYSWPAWSVAFQSVVISDVSGVLRTRITTGCRPASRAASTASPPSWAMMLADTVRRSVQPVETLPHSSATLSRSANVTR